MGQSLARNYVHIVFSTKYREPLIFPPYDKELYAYLADICIRLECHPIQIGGYSEHVHILCELSRKTALMTLLQKVKSNSSSWMKTKDKYLENFRWQNGYAAFSVNYKGTQIVSRYISNQKEHHGMEDYQDEFRRLLVKHGMEWDERYVWD